VLDENGIARRPGWGGRRVSMLVAVPVVAGCAALGTLAGVLQPIHSFSRAASSRIDKRVEAPANAAPATVHPAATTPALPAARSVVALPPSSPRDVPPPADRQGSPAAASPPDPPVQREPSRRELAAPASVEPLRTGSVERGGTDVAPAASPKSEAADVSAAARPEASAPPAAKPRRQARAKRVRRTYARPAQSEPNPSAAFFSSLFGPQPK
jgi:hypothetical protein